MSVFDKFPFSLLGKPPAKPPSMWLQSPSDPAPAPVDRRIYINLQAQKRPYEALCQAALELMERELDGHTDRHDPLGFLWIITPQANTSYRFFGNVYVAGPMSSGNEKGLSLQFQISNSAIGLGILGPQLKLPIRVSQPFDWSVLDDQGFERLLHRLYFELDEEFDNVCWLQKTRAPDSGRDISATKKGDGARVLIQARHQKASLKARDVNDVVVKAETWSPSFNEVIVATTSTFTQEAVRWVDNHNSKHAGRPRVTLEPNGHLEVMLTRRPHLIAHLGLRK